MSKELFGIVVFYEPDYTTKTLKEIGRTEVKPFDIALDIFSETPNPPSQIYSFKTEEEREAGEAQLQKNIVDREWLEELFEQI